MGLFRINPIRAKAQLFEGESGVSKNRRVYYVKIFNLVRHYSNFILFCDRRIPHVNT